MCAGISTLFGLKMRGVAMGRPHVSMIWIFLIISWLIVIWFIYQFVADHLLGTVGTGFL